MNRTIARAAVLVILTLAFFAPNASAIAAPHATPRPMPTLHLPTTKLHTEFVVEVNKKGQVVRVKSGKSCPNLTFNAQTYGNVLQMWIRHPDGTAEVGLYRVSYDYNPANHSVHRAVALLKSGGTWGDKQGAATQMMEQDAKHAAAMRGDNLPSIDKFFSTPRPKPTASP
jgi:hypothetical protein